MDDGYGNLYNYGTTHIGNIFYAHGLAIITNQASQSIFPLPTLTRPATFNFYNNTINSSSIASYIDSRDTTINFSTLVLSGSPYIIQSGSTNNIILNTTTPGTYETYYSISGSINSCGYIGSNKAKITINLSVGCDFTLSVTRYPNCGLGGNIVTLDCSLGGNIVTLDCSLEGNIL
jgi:hypothetical protein